MNGWLIAGLVAAFCLASLAAFRLWGPQIISGLAKLAAQAAWDALKADQLTPEQYEQMHRCHRAGLKYDKKRNRCVEPR